MMKLCYVCLSFVPKSIPITPSLLENRRLDASSIKKYMPHLTQGFQNPGKWLQYLLRTLKQSWGMCLPTDRGINQQTCHHPYCHLSCKSEDSRSAPVVLSYNSQSMRIVPVKLSAAALIFETLLKNKY